MNVTSIRGYSNMAVSFEIATTRVPKRGKVWPLIFSKKAAAPNRFQEMWRQLGTSVDDVCAGRVRYGSHSVSSSRGEFSIEKGSSFSMTE